MILEINGEKRTLEDGVTIAALLLALGLDRRGIAIARNDDIVSASEYDHTICGSEDRIEIIRAVAGG